MDRGKKIKSLNSNLLSLSRPHYENKRPIKSNFSECRKSAIYKVIIYERRIPPCVSKNDKKQTGVTGHIVLPIAIGSK